MTVIADGEFAAAEEALLRRFYAEPLFRGIADLSTVVRQAIDRCVKDGLDAALADVADELGSKDARETAFTTCVAAAAADGHITGTEARMLQRLRAAFRIPEKRARVLAGPIAGALR
jgi:tellurite resistance protein